MTNLFRDSRHSRPGPWIFSSWGEPRSQHDGEMEQELVVQGTVTLQLKRAGKKRIADLPPQAGLYVIYRDGKPWYVGKAEQGIRARFLSRIKSLRDLGLSPNDVKDVLSRIEVECFIVVAAMAAPSSGVSRRTAKSTQKGAPLGARSGAVMVQEQRLITQHNLGGTQNVEPVVNPAGVVVQYV